ncbi:MAG: DUF6249 domain-containing protein [Gammaproteobacteria bacterium]|nr:DUF6249 domain-containing protein [Gammaproteobacteria bacterium]
MKTFFYSLLLSSLFIAPVWADSHEEEVMDEDSGFNIEISIDDNEDTDEEISEEELETKIKGKFYSIIANVIDAVGDDMSEEEKTEIKNEIKEAFEEIKDDHDGIHDIVIESDGSSIFDDGISLIEAMIPITAIVYTFGMPLLIVAVVLYFSYRKKRLMHETIDQYVTSGKDIPEEVLKGLQKEVTPKNNLHRGLVMSGIGLGIFACFAVIGVIEAAAFGLIPLFIGLAQLLIWKLENK